MNGLRDVIIFNIYRSYLRIWNLVCRETMTTSKLYAKCKLGFSSYKCFDEANIGGYVLTNKFNVGALIRPSKEYNGSM